MITLPSKLQPGDKCFMGSAGWLTVRMRGRHQSIPRVIVTSVDWLEGAGENWAPSLLSDRGGPVLVRRGAPASRARRRAAYLAAHSFDANGYDIWGYDRGGHYDARHDRAPFQRSPFSTCQACDNCAPCDGAPIK